MSKILGKKAWVDYPFAPRPWDAKMYLNNEVDDDPQAVIKLEAIRPDGKLYGSIANRVIDEEHYARDLRILFEEAAGLMRALEEEWEKHREEKEADV
jgi:hypothetical protein